MKEMSATMIALIVTGILAVVGFVTVFGIVPFAQNNSAKGDLNNIASAQEMSLALQGHYVGTIADLSTGANGVSTGFVASGGVEHALATNTAGDAYVAVTKSQSGTYFARINGSTVVGEGATIATAMDLAGATTAWAGTHGITLPTATAGNGGQAQAQSVTYSGNSQRTVANADGSFKLEVLQNNNTSPITFTTANFSTLVPVGATITVTGPYQDYVDTNGNTIHAGDWVLIGTVASVDSPTFFNMMGMNETRWIVNLNVTDASDWPIPPTSGAAEISPLNFTVTQ